MNIAIPNDADHKIGIAGAPGTRCSPGSAAVTAEVWIGMAQGAKHAIALSIGEQVYAGLLLEGRVWTGAHNRAGAAAWLALNPVERQDYRKLGSLAAEVGFRGIARRLSWRVQAGDEFARGRFVQHQHSDVLVDSDLQSVRYLQQCDLHSERRPRRNGIRGDHDYCDEYESAAGVERDRQQDGRRRLDPQLYRQRNRS